MPSPNVVRRTLQKAAELAGGDKALARRLRVPLVELDKWIAGSGQPPMAIFLRAVDMVLEELPRPVPAAEPGEASSAKDCAGSGS